jgi:large subunit ribosomal protein L21
LTKSREDGKFSGVIYKISRRNIMFAIVRVAGKQYRVEEGSQVLVNRLPVEAGSVVDNAEVLLVGDDNNLQVGSPVVEGAKVSATVLSHTKGRKINIFKYKAKKNYRRRAGSRAHQTLLRIDSIAA